MEKEKKISSLISLINGNFCVTFLGGLLLGLITLILQGQIQSTQLKNKRIIELLDRKYSMIATFSNGMSQCLQSSFGMRKRSIWLNSKQYSDNKLDKYPDERNFEETRNFYEEQRKNFNTLIHPDSLIAQSLVLFKTAELIDLLKKLDSIMDRYFITNDYKELKDKFNKANRLYQNIIKLMGEEILNEYKNYW